MSLDIYFEETRPCNLYNINITHNLTDMASALNIYELLWHGHGVEKAVDLIAPLTDAIHELHADPERYAQYESPNGWGTVDQFLDFLVELKSAAILYPEATVEQSR